MIGERSVVDFWITYEIRYLHFAALRRDHYLAHVVRAVRSEIANQSHSTKELVFSTV